MGRGNFAVVERQKSLFSGTLTKNRCFALLSLRVILKPTPLAAATTEDATRAAAVVHESSDTVRSRKAQC